MGVMQAKARRRALRHGRAVWLLAISWMMGCGDETPVDGDAGMLPDAPIPTDAPRDAPLDGCVAQPFPSENRDIDILFVMSTAASMATIDGDASPDSRWASASKAVSTFTASLSGQAFGAGLSFFPVLRPGDAGTPVEACTSADYEPLAFSIGGLDADGERARAIDATLQARSLEGGSTLTAALTGALKSAARAKERTGHVILTVLVADGPADSCGGDVASAAAAAREAFARDYLETYVLAVGPDAKTLDPIAAAGGTFHVYSADSDGIGTALSALGASMRRCHFFLASTWPPYGAVRLTFAIDYGEPTRQFISRVDDGSTCSQMGGWFFNSNSTPAYAILCPATCEGLLQRPEREVSGMFGCLTAPATSTGRRVKSF